MTTDPYRLRTLASQADYPLVSAVLSDAFGEDWLDEDDDHEEIFEPGRNHVVEHDADGAVANAGAYTRDVGVPGATVPAGHVTLVGVRQTHRRRGLARRLMHHQLADIRDRGEPIAMLWASEGRIYQRFGYGLAARRHILTADIRNVRFVSRPGRASGRLRAAVPAEARKELRMVYERARPDRPGWSSRGEAWWTRRLADPAKRRDGHTALKAVLFDGRGGVDGYALWRRKSDWDDNGPRGLVEIREVVAATPEAYAAIWEFLLDLDLSRTVGYDFAAVDEPRALGARVADALWVRVVDVPAALGGRRYAAPVDVVLDVDDPLLAANTGRWRLTGDRAGASCVPTTDPADLACGIRDLGAVYLGGGSLAALAAAGRVRELRPGTLGPAATAFGWDRRPSALEIF